jgi:hypothetical protein
MAIAVTVEQLSKRYRIGELHSAYGTLRDALAAAGHRLVHPDHRSTTRTWGSATSRSSSRGAVLG